MITNCQFVEEGALRRKHTYISTGLIPNIKPIEKTIGTMLHYECPFTILHCVGTYPCDPGDVNLEMIRTLKSRFPFASIGFSSHTVSPVIGAASALYGIDAVEAHITLDRSMYGSDQAASLEEPGLRRLVDYVALLEQARGDGIKRMTDKEREVAGKLRYWENG